MCIYRLWSKNLYSSQSLFNIYGVWAISFTRVTQEMESRCTDSLSLGGSGKHESIFSLLLLILLFQYSPMKRLQGAHTHLRPFETYIQSRLLSFLSGFKQQKGFSLFCLLLSFIFSAFLYLSASSGSDPLTGDICSVSQVCLTQLPWDHPAAQASQVFHFVAL